LLPPWAVLLWVALETALDELVVPLDVEVLFVDEVLVEVVPLVSSLDDVSPDEVVVDVFVLLAAV